ncbi:DNA-binding response OmpR family regulator [Cerasibacillus quisquiliarum]|nr:hypothetical protein [Cerasibacillus quisquiliarum]MBB5147366.1 DNA-binding response OmpR family regulator [Cerasibacillus quisquiliarum]
MLPRRGAVLLHACRLSGGSRYMVGEALEKWGFETVKIEDFDQIMQVFLNYDHYLVIMDINLL